MPTNYATQSATDSITILAEVEAACRANNLAIFCGKDSLLKRVALMDKRSIVTAKLFIRLRFGDRFAPSLVNRSIRFHRAVFLRAEAELCKAKYFESDSRIGEAILAKVKDPGAVAMGRRGGLFRGKKGFAAITAERGAAIRLLAGAAVKRNRAARAALGSTVWAAGTPTGPPPSP